MIKTVLLIVCAVWLGIGAFNFVFMFGLSKRGRDAIKMKGFVEALLILLVTIAGGPVLFISAMIEVAKSKNTK